MRFLKLMAVCLGVVTLMGNTLFIYDNHLKIKEIDEQQIALTKSIESTSKQLEELEAELQEQINIVQFSKAKQVDETMLELNELKNAQSELKVDVDEIKELLKGSSANFQ